MEGFQPPRDFASLIPPQSVAAFGERIIGHRDQWLQAVDNFQQTLAATEHPHDPILITTNDPIAYVAQCLSALANGHSVVCGSPDWTPVQRQELTAQWPRLAAAHKKGPVPFSTARQFLYLSTGGTGGRLKFARHSSSSIIAAIRSLAVFLEQDCLSAVAVLRPFHTGGLMPWLRAFFSAGHVLPAHMDALAGGSLRPPQQAVLSLVPTQLHTLLRIHDTAWSRGIETILLGGAPASAELLHAAHRLALPVMPCYGMTETAGLVAAQRREECNPGEPVSARLLPGNHVEVNESGQIVLQSAALFAGYGDEPPRMIEQWPTGDCGYIDGDGRLVVTCRLRPWINSGGKKIAPERVEAAIAAAFPDRQVRVIPHPDPKWGQVVAVIMTGPTMEVDTLRNALRNLLPPEGLPRLLRCVDAIPVDERGKTSPDALQALLARLSDSDRQL